MSDYISRDELLELYAPDPDCDKCSVPFPVVRQNILDMPAADVAPVRHGRWIPSDYTGDCCYTCSECGFERDAYLLDVGDYCPACGARMDKEDNMNKPLSEWTLGEVKAECEKHTAHCVGCPLWTDAAGCRLDTSCYRDNDPKKWDLSEPPRWTEQDKEDAKAIRHIISCRGLKYGRSAATGKLYVMWDGSNNVCDIDAITDIGLNPNLLPSLKPGEVVTLDEIIGGAK